MILILALVVIALLCGGLGIFAHGLFWLLIVGVVVLVAAGGLGWHRRRGIR